jgi:hypothetical protein
MVEKKDVPVFQNNPIVVLILSMLTCGLYLIFWNMKASEVLNKVAGREAIGMPVAVLAGFCLPVNIYFYYLAGEILPDLGKLIGREEELKGKTTLLLILGILFPFAAAMILQGHINQIYED